MSVIKPKFRNALFSYAYWGFFALDIENCEQTMLLEGYFDAEDRKIVTAVCKALKKCSPIIQKRIDNLSKFIDKSLKEGVVVNESRTTDKRRTRKRNGKGSSTSSSNLPREH